jgi:hypothetical protein
MLTTETGEFFSYGAPEIEHLAFGSLSVSGPTVTGVEAIGAESPLSCPTGVCVSGVESTAVSGTVSQRSTMALNGIGWTFDSLYDQPSSLSLTTGNWSNLYITGTGAFYWNWELQDPTGGCVVTGQISLINSSYNAYNLNATYSNCAATEFFSKYEGATAQGIAYINPSGSAPTFEPQLSGMLRLVAPDGSSFLSAFGGQQVLSVGGVWTATGNGGSAQMLAAETGQFFYVATEGSCTGLHTGTLTAQKGSTDTLSGSGIFVPVPNAAVCGSSADAETYMGSISPGTSMELTGNEMFSWSYNSVYGQPSSLAAIAGNWLTPGGDTIAISASGSLSETDATSGCTATGQISIIDPYKNAYAVSVSYANCTAVPNDLANYIGSAALLNESTVTGLATINASMSPNQLELYTEFQYTDSNNNTSQEIAYVAATSNQ